MELAKIRNKALQAKQLQDEESSKSDAQILPPAPESAENTATAELAEPITITAPETVEAEEPAILDNLPQPASSPLAESKIPKPAFDPLALIMAGRAAMQTPDEQEQEADNDLALTNANNELYEDFLCFTLAGEEYGINIVEIKEIIKVRELTEVPRTPDFIDGVLSLRGVIVPVLDMRKRMEMPAGDPSQHQRIIIVKNGESLTGLRVDRVTGVARITESCRETTPGVLDGTARDFVSGIGRYDASMLILLDIAAVIDFNLDEVQSHA